MLPSEMIYFILEMKMTSLQKKISRMQIKDQMNPNKRSFDTEALSPFEDPIEHLIPYIVSYYDTT